MTAGDTAEFQQGRTAMMPEGRGAPAIVRALLMLAIAGIWLYSAAHFLQTGIRLALGQFYGDLLGNFPSGTLMRWLGREESMFAGTLAEEWLPVPLWGYGPVLHLLTLPLVWLLGTLRQVYQALLVANYAFLGLAVWRLYRLVAPARRRGLYATLLAAVVLNFYPLYEAILQRNVEIFELMLIVWAMDSFVRRRDALAGVLIGVAAMTKFLPGIFIGYFLLKGRWRAAAAGTATIAVLAALAQVTLGWQHNSVLMQLAHGSYLDLHLNQSLVGFLLRLLWWLPGREAWAKAAMFAGIAGFGWLMIRLRHHQDWRLEWSLVLVGMIMLLPHNQNYYLVFLIVPYAVLLSMILDRALTGWPWITAVAASFLLVGWPVPLSLVDRLFGLPAGLGAEWLLWLSLPVCGVILLVVALIKAAFEPSTSAVR